MSTTDQHGQALHELLQQLGPPPPEPSEPNERMAEGVVLTGWVVVTEWMDSDANRWLVRTDADSKTEWEADGMLHFALEDLANNE